MLYYRREVVKGAVFTPRMAGPTMTVEEWGEAEMRHMKAAEEEEQRQYAVGEKVLPVRRWVRIMRVCMTF